MKKHICLVFLLFAGSAEDAFAGSAISVRLSAHVDAYCHIYLPGNTQVTITNGAGTIGLVREICNTPGGYDVTTHFTNVSTGQLTINADSYPLHDGSAVRSSLVPAVRQLTWSLTNVQLAAANMPVTMSVVISPRS